MISVAIVEDNPDVLDDLAFNLEKAAFRVSTFSDGAQLDAALQKGQKWTVMVVDIGLPTEDGFSIANRMRGACPAMGLIALTAYGRLEDRVRGLSEAFDLYLVKPVEIPELIAAIHAVGRRSLQMDRYSTAWRLNRHGPAMVRPDGQEVPLTLTEHLILSAFANSESGTVSRDDLVRAMGRRPDSYDPRALEVAISRIRMKLGPREPLKAVRNQGYYFAAKLITMGDKEE